MGKSEYNLLNQQSILTGNVDNKEKIRVQAKIELLKELKRQPLKIGDIAKQLSENRRESRGLPKEITIGGKSIQIDSNRYKDIFANYNWFLGNNNDEGLEGTDWALAQRLILDSGNMIVFEDQPDEAKKAFDDLNQDNRYKDKIELLQKKKKEKDLSIIKRTEKEQRKIDKLIAEKEAELERRKSKKAQSARNAESSTDVEPESGNNLNTPGNQIENISEGNIIQEVINLEELKDVHLINRDNLADNIRELREKSSFKDLKQVEIQSGVYIDVTKHKRRKDYLKKFEEAEKEGNENKLKDLDTQFAELLIIDTLRQSNIEKSLWIQINNDEPEKDIKSDEKLEEESRRCEEALNGLGYDVEYVKIITGIDVSKQQELEDMREYIEELEKRISRLKSELNSKELYSSELGRVKKQDELKKLEEKLVRLRNDYNRLSELVEKNKKIYHVIRKKQGKLSPHIPVIPEVPEVEVPEVKVPEVEAPKKERTATISNVESVHLEEANYRAEEQARNDYEALGRLRLFDPKSRKPWERMKTYVLRTLRRQQRRTRHLSAVKGNIDLTREDVVLASDRHEMEHGDGTRRGGITRRLVSHNNPDIDLLCKEFLTTNMLDREFERRFNAILSLDPTVMSVIGTNRMEYLASNILLKLKNEKAEYEMVNEISSLVAPGPRLSQPDFENRLKQITDKYFKETQKNYPEYIQRIMNKINDPIEINRIVSHQKSLLNEEVKTLQMQLQLLDNTTGAYEIDNRDKERGFWYKFGAWMDRHPYLTIGGSVLAGTGILATGGLLGGVVGAATATGLLATKVGMMTAAKKASHYTKEQKGQEKRLTHGLNIEKQAMNNIYTVMNSAPWGSWRKYKAKRQFNLYQESTQKNIVDTTMLIGSINRFVGMAGALSATETSALYNYLSDGLARVDYYKSIGHNFVASQDRKKVEIDMRNLYNSIVQGADKLGTNVTAIRGNPQYTALIGSLTTDYNTSMANFRTQRRRLELKYGLGSALVYGGTAVGLQRALGSGIFGNHPCTGTKTVVVGGGRELALHDEVRQSLIDAGASSDNVRNIETALRNAPASPSAGGYNQQARWTIVKNEMGWQDSQLNSWMHNFMENTVWTLNEGGVSELKQQLLDARINSLSANSPAARVADSFLSSPKIGLINQGEGTQVLENLKSRLSGTDIATFTAEEKMKMGYYSHLFIGNDSGMGSRLTEMLTKMQDIPGTSITVPIEDVICNRHYWLDGVGMPVFANTFMERMKPNKDEEGKLIEIPENTPVLDPTIVITDKNNPASTTPTSTYNWLTGK